MSPLGEEFKHCEEKGCPEKIKNHAWGHIKAADEGWFQQKNGTVWCPKHIPKWVEEWRKRKAREKESKGKKKR